MCSFFPDRGGRGGVTVVVSEVDDTETNMTGLTPSVLYTFSVTAENEVSSQDNNINVRTVNTTATTEEGGLFGSQSSVKDWVSLSCLWTLASFSCTVSCLLIMTSCIM